MCSDICDSPQQTPGGAGDSEITVQAFVTKPHKYPNPGYLGSFSHTTLFDHLSGMEDSPFGDSSHASGQERHLRSDGAIMQANILRGAKLVEHLDEVFSFSLCDKLVRTWLAKGANLALAGPFTERCAQTVQCIFPDRGGSPLNTMEISRNLFLHSCGPLNVGPKGTIQDFCAKFCQYNARWETLGLFFAAVSRAATDLSCHESLFETEQERRDLQRWGMTFSDLCLDTSISLDCLNDLQLILQYENFILHSFVDGDQSKLA